ncbi:MAG: hypothetical protein IJZ68_06735 [Bacteroidaceae bacterium]|nr:hypothetical protein [Bacteroidaceae bacterium]
MDILKLHNLQLEDEIVDKEACFRLGYCKEIGSYVAVVLQFWIANYERWYSISQDDYLYYREDRDGFLQKHRWKLAHNLPTPLDLNFIGASAIREYDCRDDITRIFNSNGNPFQGFVYMHGAFWARIKTDADTILIPPKRHLCTGHPLREIEGVRLIRAEINGEMCPLCYGIPMSEIIE